MTAATARCHMIQAMVIVVVSMSVCRIVAREFMTDHLNG